MSFTLSLLGDVRWRQQPVVGDRPQALLAALAKSAGRPVPASDLIELVWADEPPVNALKALQVLISRTRTACGADAIVRDGTGYRLGAAPGEVDTVRLAELVKNAAAELDQDAALAAGHAQEALAGGLHKATAGETGPLADLRRAAAADLDTARAIQARAASRMGAHNAALPALEAAYAERPGDESLLTDLLHSEAAVRGPAAALERYEQYRRGLRDRLGADPGEQLKRVHRELLAMDRPVRRGLRYDATPLIGRDGDLDRLRALTGSSRVVSIVGPGGLGKTRLANAIARDAAVPVVHVVELAGVSSPDDVVGEVGSVLGVRDSIQGRRILTTQQRADVRGRIAQRLAQSPGLLVLDNCEHLIDAVAGLVAFLVAATSDLHVLTTSRAPLGIAAERVYLLGELGTGDAKQLFRERATAARPNVQLPEPPVTSIAHRLDGLPLAIELAAVQVRAMSVEEIDRRLENRFALLRGGDRTAPDRHQTLLAVIDWSWNLLRAPERRALQRLALFNDGFTLEAAEQVLGGDALPAVQGLVGQSLLAVRETPLGVRYRMLETVREFGRMQLVDAGEDRDTRAAVRGWAVAYAREHGARLTGTGQYAAMDAVRAEEVNLADELRGAIADGDHGALVELLACLGTVWMIRGEHTRLLALADAVTDALPGWRPPPELQDAAGAAIALILSNSMIAGGERIGRLQELLRGLGPEAGGDRRMAGLTVIMLAYDPAEPGAFAGRLERLVHDQDRQTAIGACYWLANMRENAGDLPGAIAACQRALSLVTPDDGPWAWAMPRSLLAQLAMAAGDRAAAVTHARAAIPVMQRLGASDDEVQLRRQLAFCAIADGHLAEAAAELDRIDAVVDGEMTFGGAVFGQMCHAELMLAQGDHTTGLSRYRDSMIRMRELEFPGVPRTGVEPWTLFSASMALAAHAWYATAADEEDEEYGRALFRRSREDVVKVLDGADQGLDYPVVGQLLFALGAWSLLHEATAPDDAIRLLVLAERFAYNRSVPTLLWERIEPVAEERAPGRIAACRAQYAERRPADLVKEARRAAEQ